MSEVFIFLSGFVCGGTYLRVLNTCGFWACQYKAIYRCVQIYLAHVLTLFAHLAILGLIANWWGEQDKIPFANFREFERQPTEFLVGILKLQKRVAYFDILPVYMAILPFLPLMLLLRSVRWWLAPAISVGVYILTLIFHIDAILLPRWTWGLQPLAWQFLFFGGAFLAIFKISPTHFLAQRSIVLGIAVVLFQLLFTLKAFAPQMVHFSNRHLLEPIRLVHFTSAMVISQYFVSLFIPLKQESWSWSLPVLLCGQNTLVTYCFGGILANVLMLYSLRNRSLLAAIGVNVVGWGGCILAAYLASLMKKRRSDEKLRHQSSTVDSR